MVKMTFRFGSFYAKTTFESRTIPKEAGFFWDQTRKLWITSHHANAARLRPYADEKAKEELDRLLIKIRPWTGSIPFPKGLKPYPFQIEKAVPWALARNKAYLALDPGLGKTICAALYLNALNANAVYICPPFLMGNVEAEFKKWLTGDLKRVLRFGRDPLHRPARVLIIPDSLLLIPKRPKGAKNQARYDKASERWGQLRCAVADFVARGPCSLIVDEAHRFKNVSTGRTKALFTYIAPSFERTVFLSGTPMPNGRPMELWPVLSNCAPEVMGFRKHHDFGLYFCNAFESDFGWDYTGVSNVKELAENLKQSFMLRMRKDEVLEELPPKTESVVVLDTKLPPKLARLDRLYLEQLKDKLQASETPTDTHLSTYRHEIGVAKAPLAAKYVREILTDSGEAILLFAIHKEVIDSLSQSLKEFEPLVITGDVDKDERFRRAQEFQKVAGKRLMILNIQAGGVGFNLTKASRVVFAEYAWVPGDNEQASDRAHRIGQKDNVLVNYLVYPDSLDAAVLTTVLSKRKVTQHV